MLGSYQQIIRNASALQLPQTFEHSGPHQPAVIRLVVHRVADALELWIGLQAIEYMPQSRRRQVRPGDYALDEGVLSSQLEQPFRLLRLSGGLHCDRTIESIALKFGLQVLWQKIPAQRR